MGQSHFARNHGWAGFWNPGKALGIKVLQGFARPFFYKKIMKAASENLNETRLFPINSNQFQSLFKKLKKRKTMRKIQERVAGTQVAGNVLRLIPLRDTTAGHWRGKAGRMASRRGWFTVITKHGDLRWFPINSNQFQSLFKKLKPCGEANRVNVLADGQQMQTTIFDDIR